MGVEIAILMAEFGQPCGQQAEVARLVGGDAHPVGVIGLRHAAEALHRIPG